MPVGLGQLSSQARAMLMAVAAVSYLTWVLMPWLNRDVGPVTGFVSELSARDQPYAQLMRAADVIAGFLIGLAALTRGGAMERRQRLGWSVLVLFAVATVIDAGVLAMDCAPSVDAQCKSAEQASTVTLAHQAHAVSSSIASVALPAAAFLLAPWLYPPPVEAQSPWPARWVWAITALLALLTLVVTGVYLAGASPLVVGVVQRLGLVVSSVWLLLVARALWRRMLA